jgi:thioredoxin reductase
MKNYDVLIIGGGAAGLSAALVLSRARRRVLVVDSGAPRNAPAAHMHGFLSRDGMPPADLIASGRAEVARYGGIVVRSTVDDLRAADQGADGVPSVRGFNARLGDGAQVYARRVLVAAGMRDELPDVPGLRERWARDVLHCPYCHGYEVRDQRLGVLWNGPGTPDYAQIVRQWSDDVVLFVPTDVLTPSQRTGLVARAIGIIEAAVTGLRVVDDTLSSVTLEDGREVHRDALFVPPTFTAHSSLLTQLGAATDDAGWVTIGKSGDTSVPGVWAAGNVTNPRAQVITAAGEGSAAAIAINADLVAEDVRAAIEEFGPLP